MIFNPVRYGKSSMKTKTVTLSARGSGIYTYYTNAEGVVKHTTGGVTAEMPVGSMIIAILVNPIANPSATGATLISNTKINASTTVYAYQVDA